MRRTPKNLPQIQDRRAEVVKLRAEGKTWDAIAAEVGYANGSAALKAWRRAIAQKPDLAVTEVRAQERERLEMMDAELGRIVAMPPAKTTAIGKTVTDPDTGETVRDMSVVVAALRERRMVGESYRRLTGADATPPPAVIFDQRSQVLIGQISQAQAQLDAAAPRPALPPPPPGYANMTPAEQARADLERRRAQIDTQRSIVRGEVLE